MRSWLYRGAVITAAIVGLIFIDWPVAHARQPATIVLTVVDSLAGYPLANADITNLATGQHRITDELGQTYFTWPSIGQLRLRVREVGYQPRRITVSQSVTGGATTVSMTKVAYVLSTVQATSRCTTTADTTLRDLSVAVLDQLKQGAEKYIQFREAYPFEATVEWRTAAIPEQGDVKRIVVAKQKFQSDSWESPYKPGDIFLRDHGDYTVPLLFLSTLADSVFWEHHCFAARGVEWYQGARVIRLDFSPTSDVKGPDYEGAALLDSATSFLLRVDFRLANAYRRNGPRKLEGYTTFMSPSPFVIMPDSTMAVWWVRDPDHGEWGKPDFAQGLHIKELRYRKQKPPGYEKAKQ